MNSVDDLVRSACRESKSLGSAAVETGGVTYTYVTSVWPRIVTLISVVVPSEVATVNVSTRLSPVWRASTVA